MIGLGSNRLSVCRRGGMSVTQAGRGGMEWLAGGRCPSWASPYSAQATAALKAQFPTQWPTIRDYGSAHPEIVGYMNAYAPEDAKIAYSLVPTLGVIRAIENINGAWLDTGLYGGLTSYYIKMQLYTPSDSNYYLFGNFNQTGQSGLFRYDSSTVSFLYYVGSSATYITLGTTNKWIDIETNPTEIKADGVVKAAFPSNPTKLTNSILLLWGTGIGTAFNGKGKSGRLEMWNDSMEKVRDFVPFIRDNKNGMLDILTGTFYENKGSGQFTISETPAS